MASVWQGKAWLLAGATAVAGVALAVVLYGAFRSPEPVAPTAPAPVAQAPVVPAPAPVAPPADDAASAAPEAAPDTEPAIPADAVPDVAVAAQPELAQPEPAPSAPVTPEAAAIEPPSFDVVRVAEDGGALVAGSAPGGAAVVLRVDDAPVARVEADAAGQFVAIFWLDPSETVQILTLEAELAGGGMVRADDVVVLTPRAAPALAALAEPAMAAPDAPPAIEAPATDDAGAPPSGVAIAASGEPAAGAVETADAASEPAPEAGGAAPAETDTATLADQPAEAVALAGSETPAVGELAADELAAGPTARETATAEPEATATESPEITIAGTDATQTDATQTETAMPESDAGAVLAADGAAEAPMPRAFLLGSDGGVRVLDRAPQVMDNVVIDAIAYSAQGDVQISGRAARGGEGASLRIYLDNRPVAVARAADGDWSSDLPDIDPGIYTLRVDQLNPEGRVVSRFETPFQREDPQIVAMAQARATGNGTPAADGTAGTAPAASMTAPMPASTDAGALPAEPVPAESVLAEAVPSEPAPTVPTSAGASDSASPEPAPVSAAPEIAQVPAPDAAPVPGTVVASEPAPVPETASETAPETATDTATAGMPAAAVVPAADEPAPLPSVAAAAPEPAMTAAAPRVALVTVQPGQSLWRISREHYGAGAQYVVIYQANRAQIRNPDLIYPGQVFILPE